MVQQQISAIVFVLHQAKPAIPAAAKLSSRTRINSWRLIFDTRHFTFMIPGFRRAVRYDQSLLPIRLSWSVKPKSRSVCSNIEFLRSRCHGLNSRGLCTRFSIGCDYSAMALFGMIGHERYNSRVRNYAAVLIAADG